MKCVLIYRIFNKKTCSWSEGCIVAGGRNSSWGMGEGGLPTPFGTAGAAFWLRVGAEGSLMAAAVFIDAIEFASFCTSLWRHEKFWRFSHNFLSPKLDDIFIGTVAMSIHGKTTSEVHRSELTKPDKTYQTGISMTEIARWWTQSVLNSKLEAGNQWK